LPDEQSVNVVLLFPDCFDGSGLITPNYRRKSVANPHAIAERSLDLLEVRRPISNDRESDSICLSRVFRHRVQAAISSASNADATAVQIVSANEAVGIPS
jgi:hypothetical protein